MLDEKIELLQNEVTDLKIELANVAHVLSVVSYNISYLKEKKEREEKESYNNPCLRDKKEGECEGEKEKTIPISKAKPILREECEKVIELWNSQLAKPKRWRVSRFCDADIDKVRSSLRRNEFKNNWENSIGLLASHGLNFVGDDGRYVINGKSSGGKPSIEWFCRKTTMRNILEGAYWKHIQDVMEKEV